jgi:phosphoribosylformylglycinamidine synthase
MRPKAFVLRVAGTNCDQETAFAFRYAGATAELIHINELLRKERSLEDYHILAIPGGFTYGDDIAAGKILANELRCRLKEALSKFVRQGKLIIGICNGFQVLVKAGLLPGWGQFKQDATLAMNDSGKFEDRWVYLKKPETRRVPQSETKAQKPDQDGSAQRQRGETRVQKPERCVWTRGVEKIIYLPVAHAEGKFIPKDDAVINRLRKNGQIVFEYVDDKGQPAGYPWNPNGSVANIAGICDPTGRVLGLMPHPERHIFFTQHPQWTRIKTLKGRIKKDGPGIKIFENAVKYAKRNL